MQETVNFIWVCANLATEGEIHHNLQVEVPISVCFLVGMCQL